MDDNKTWNPFQEHGSDSHDCSRQVLKVSLRFEKLLQQRKASEDGKTMNDSEILADIVKKYNDFKANAGIRKWQISPDQHLAIWGVICGLTSDSRDLLRSHLDFNKWEESGPSAAFVSASYYIGLRYFVNLPFVNETKATMKAFCAPRGTSSMSVPRMWPGHGAKSWLCLSFIPIWFFFPLLLHLHQAILSGISRGTAAAF